MTYRSNGLRPDAEGSRRLRRGRKGLPGGGAEARSDEATARRAPASRSVSRGSSPAAGVVTNGSGRWTVAITMGFVAAIDLGYGKEASLVVALVFGPFVACALTTVSDTIFTAVVATILSVALGWPDGTIGTSAHIVRVAAVAVGGGLAVWLAVQRSRREAKLVAVTRVAEAAQQTVLHPLPEAIDGMRVTARYLSAAAEARIGGDFYDAASTPWGLRLVVGDVRGKGLEAVRLASVLLGEFRSRAASEPDLAALASLVDQAGRRHTDESGEEFATAVFVQMHERLVTTVRCGHPYPLLFTSGTAAPVVSAVSLPLCLAGTPVADTHPLPAGARLLYYSDGAFEGRDRRGREFDLVASFARHGGAPVPEDTLDLILSDLRHHCAKGIDDDVVLVLVEETSPRVAGALRE